MDKTGFAATLGLTRDRLRTDRADGIDMLRALLALWVVFTHLVAWTVAVQGAAAGPPLCGIGLRDIECAA
jgi:peptidoglycan/LPS O-acetylase OafA/YrhL